MGNRFDLSAIMLAPLFGPVVWFFTMLALSSIQGHASGLSLMWLMVAFGGVVVATYFISMPIFWVLSKVITPKRLNTRRHYAIFVSIILVSILVFIASALYGRSFLVLTPSAIIAGVILNATSLVYFGHIPDTSSAGKESTSPPSL